MERETLVDGKIINMENNNSSFNVPILFLIFNRPDTTERVFSELRKLRPTTLYISADGARSSKVGEEKLCEATRKITELVDWPCVVHRKYEENNLGCMVGVSQAITWFFDNVTEGIILEDDCLPDPSFFSFSQELLEKYRNVEQVKMISGNNFQFGKKYNSDSYYFSNFHHIWGWATWKRAWSEYDIGMKTYPNFKKENKISKIFVNEKIQKFWISIFDKLYQNKMNSWAGRWIYAIYDHNGISINPSLNLISNIGFNDDATHTKSDDILNNISCEKITEVIHPLEVIINKEADEFTFKKVFYKSIFTSLLAKIKSL